MSYCHPQNVDIEKERELERQARIEASLREREREVQKARSEQTKEIDREREQHKREEAIQHFKALMSDMVRRLQRFKKKKNKNHETVQIMTEVCSQIPLVGAHSKCLYMVVCFVLSGLCISKNLTVTVYKV